MAISSGLAELLLVDEFNLGPVTQQLNGAMEINQLDHTTIDLSAVRRNGGKRHGRLNPTVFFDDAAGGSVPVLANAPTTDRAVSWLLGQTRGDGAMCMVAKQVSFGPQVDQAGMLTIPVNCEANNYGLEGARQLTNGGFENATTASTTTGIDEYGAVGSTDFGAQAFLHVEAFTGTSCTIAVQDSDDNGVDPWADCGLTFTAVTGVGWERIATSSDTENIKRWLRCDLTGTFSNIDFSVMVVRNYTARAF